MSACRQPWNLRQNFTRLTRQAPPVWHAPIWRVHASAMPIRTALTLFRLAGRDDAETPFH
jgi:hypothetical protein